MCNTLSKHLELDPGRLVRRVTACESPLRPLPQRRPNALLEQSPVASTEGGSRLLEVGRRRRREGDEVGSGDRAERWRRRGGFDESQQDRQEDRNRLRSWVAKSVSLRDLTERRLENPLLSTGTPVTNTAMQALIASSTTLIIGSDDPSLLREADTTISRTAGKMRPAQKASVPEEERDAAIKSEKRQLRAAV